MALLILNYPPNFNFGIDWMSWTVGEKFTGVANIPDGVHFIYWSAKELRGSDCSVRSGTFLHFDTNQIHVWTWDTETEMLVPLSEDAAVPYQEGASRHEFDATLGPYPVEHQEKWSSLTKHLKRSTMERLSPVAPSTGGANSNTSSSSSSSSSGRSFYTTLPGRRPQPIKSSSTTTALTPSDITKYAFDRTQALSEVLQSLRPHCSEERSEEREETGIVSAMFDLLGELEYSFIQFVVGQSEDGLEQWKNIVDLVCRCEDAMEGRAAVNYPIIPVKCFEHVHEMLTVQLMEVPEDFFAGDLSSNNFLKPALSSFFQLWSMDSERRNVLLELTRARFGWDISAEEEDDLFGM